MALASRARFERLGPSSVPALLAHPNWSEPAPTVIWMHGRTVDKTLDSGRYLRWIRAGIAACAIDLPGHGERAEAVLQLPISTPKVLIQVVSEIDQVIEALADPRFAGVFDLDRLAIGGMSAGGMATLRRLCDPHPFVCAAVESSAGNLGMLYDPARGWNRPAPEMLERIDPMQRVATFRPIPLLALHSRADRTIPVACIESFLAALAVRYRERGFAETLLRLQTWAQTGAQDEHNGFGRVAAEAKTMQTEFFVSKLNPTAAAPG